jgi:hypothetical protein
MFLNLVISKLEHLESIRESALSSLSFGKIINYSLIMVSLFDIVIVEVDNGIAIREYFSLNSIVKDHLLLPILIYSLDFTIVTDDLFNDLHILRIFVVIFLGELHIVIFLLFFCCMRLRIYLLLDLFLFIVLILIDLILVILIIFLVQVLVLIFGFGRASCVLILTFILVLKDTLRLLLAK